VILARTGLVEQSIHGAAAIPGGIGLAFVPLLQAVPLAAGLILLSLPWLYVRRRRRRLVAEIEGDLPIFLELLSTLVESGHSFDAALAQLLDSEPEPRQLAQEMRWFQLEVRSGRSRLQCFQRLRDRVDVGSLTTLVSAVTTAEQLGASIAQVLRAQAEDIRNRRREQALAHAQTAPVKLVFPLIICFLPGLFVTTLGPAMYELFQVIDSAVGLR
jgi:tight adherence protein C